MQGTCSSCAAAELRCDATHKCSLLTEQGQDPRLLQLEWCSTSAPSFTHTGLSLQLNIPKDANACCLPSGLQKAA